ncbi:MAG: response regulator [Oscillospiraceae bacterium]|nr:response regulator [Oscillospiraceae bacterium]
MSLKILVTGRNEQIAADICDHVERDRGDICLKCLPIKQRLLKVMFSEMPQAVIICMRDDNRGAVKVFDVLRKCMDMGTTSIIVVANAEDRKTFISNTTLGKVTFLERPVFLNALYYKLAEIEKDWDRAREEIESQLTEYVDPRRSTDIVRKRILVVDDDPEQLMQIKEHLREFYDVALVSSGRSAFKFLEKEEPDLILLDYMMPEMNGPAVLKELREDSAYQEIPVVFLTGVSEKETVTKTIVELKPQGYVLKPTKKSELVAKIIDVLG